MSNFWEKFLKLLASLSSSSPEPQSSHSKTLEKQSMPSSKTDTHKDLYAIEIEQILLHEGGAKFTNDPSDPGGPTKWGVSLRYLRKQKAINGDLDGDGDIDIDDILAINEATARDLYYRDWWLKGPYNDMPATHGDAIRKMFNLAINMGQPTVNKLLQRALRACTGANLTEDGRIGPKSLAEVRKANPDMLLCALKMAADGHYRYLIARNSKLAKYQRGWLNRAHA